MYNAKEITSDMADEIITNLMDVADEAVKKSKLTDKEGVLKMITKDSLYLDEGKVFRNPSVWFKYVEQLENEKTQWVNKETQWVNKETQWVNKETQWANKETQWENEKTQWEQEIEKINKEKAQYKKSLSKAIINSIERGIDYEDICDDYELTKEELYDIINTEIKAGRIDGKFIEKGFG
jgi:ATPase subunit of ABC transporter with duplicated ATPase domains